MTGAGTRARFRRQTCGLRSGRHSRGRGRGRRGGGNGRGLFGDCRRIGDNHARAVAEPAAAQLVTIRARQTTVLVQELLVVILHPVTIATSLLLTGPVPLCN